jgi:hypothetical protein
VPHSRLATENRSAPSVASRRRVAVFSGSAFLYRRRGPYRQSPVQGKRLSSALSIFRLKGDASAQTRGDRWLRVVANGHATDISAVHGKIHVFPPVIHKDL